MAAILSWPQILNVLSSDVLFEPFHRCIHASLGENELTHWGRVTHICVSDLPSIGSDNGLAPGRRQAIIRTNAGILLIRPLGTNFSEFLAKILIFSFKKMRLKVSSAKRRPFCIGLNEWVNLAWRVYCLSYCPPGGTVMYQNVYGTHHWFRWWW